MCLIDGLLLAHYEKGCSKICEEVPWLSSASQSNPYPSAKLAKHGYLVAFPYMGARFGGTNQPPFQQVHLDPGGH